MTDYPSSFRRIFCRLHGIFTEASSSRHIGCTQCYHVSKLLPACQVPRMRNERDAASACSSSRHSFSFDDRHVGPLGDLLVDHHRGRSLGTLAVPRMPETANGRSGSSGPSGGDDGGGRGCITSRFGAPALRVEQFSEVISEKRAALNFSGRAAGEVGATPVRLAPSLPLLDPTSTILVAPLFLALPRATLPPVPSPRFPIEQGGRGHRRGRAPEPFGFAPVQVAQDA